MIVIETKLKKIPTSCSKCFYCYRTHYIGGDFVCLALRKKLTQNKNSKVELKQGKCLLKEI